MFCQLKSVRKLIDTDMLPTSMYTANELNKIKSSSDFYSWSARGYYVVKYVHVCEC